MTKAWEDYKKTMASAVTLQSAAKENDVAALEQLLAAGAKINAKDHRGYSALMLAAYSDSAAAFDLLLSSGADVHSRDAAGNTILMGASFKGHLQMVRKLLAAGADPLAKNDSGFDAAGVAKMFGRHDVVALLTDSATAKAPSRDVQSVRV